MKSLAIVHPDDDEVMTYRVVGNQPVPSPLCAIIYGHNPHSEANAIGVVTCTGADRGVDVSAESMEAFAGIKLSEETVPGSLAARYAVTGAAVTLSLYSGPNLDTDSTKKVTIPAGVEQVKYFVANLCSQSFTTRFDAVLLFF